MTTEEELRVRQELGRRLSNQAVPSLQIPKEEYPSVLVVEATNTNGVILRYERTVCVNVMNSSTGHKQCIQKKFRPPSQFLNFVTLQSDTTLRFFSSLIYSQFPIMTEGKQNFRNVCKFIKKQKYHM